MDNTVTFAAIVGFICPPASLPSSTGSGGAASSRASSPSSSACSRRSARAGTSEASTGTTDRAVLPIVFGAAILTFHQFWKPSGIAPTIEKNT
jgi:hypothetical protein